ncbi:GNAT family N-acetyltransferase [Gorillibacterium timonense]|uniref:GNAT family N-acetyltransferase n=1 Tax=Gorillibacterium timonense TaxID=1689269 RepID=UPI00071D9CEA|nr:GNAT family N-acetyltransferase [Gorillibacterium timonense]
MLTQEKTDSVRIVEYDHSYARAVADMWNRSNESWGGGNSQRTEDSVRSDMENSTNLHVFLAIDGEEVVGFCSFSHYKSDEGALYVPLLNVRPDYHGRKVGRNLILNAVRKTVEMGWPRLDLFTWAGNTKAVPMYKKCGFFWEKKDNSVHLMNFIPTVLQTEALAAYFKKVDWYADSTRKLVIEPDGRRVRGFDFFEYTWQKNGLSLRAEFEKTGRGLTGLTTPEYEISTEVEDHDLVFGGRYKVLYRIANKSAAPLAIEMKGRDDKNIRFASSCTITVAPGAVETIEGEFALDPIEEEQNDWKTHPVVMSEWLIDGLRAEFRLGVAPKFPAKITMTLPNRELFPGVPAELYLNIENNFREEAEFAFGLPADDAVEWEKPGVSIRVPAKGKASVPVPFILKRYGLFTHEVDVQAKPVSQAEVTFKRKLHVLIKGLNGLFGGDAGEHWSAVNGPLALHLTKQNNDLWIDYPHFNHSAWWMYPKLGKPFSAEFSKKQAEDVKIHEESNSLTMEILFESEDFPGYQIKSVAKLLGSGLVEHYYEVCNTGDEEAEESLTLLNNFGFFGEHFILPYRGRYVDMMDEYSGSSDHWDAGELTENWMFCKGDHYSYGICWDASLPLVKTEWFNGLEIPLGKIGAKASVRTSSTFIAIGTFGHWWDFRCFAQKRRDPIIPVLDRPLDLVVNGGNPFGSGEVTVELIERKNVEMAGTYSLSLVSGDGQEREAARVELPQADVHTGRLILKPEVFASSGKESKIQAEYQGEDWTQRRTALFFQTGDEPVDCSMEETSAGTTYSVSNGVLSIAATPAFGNVVHSLKQNGVEWLDSSFPEPCPRSWWNPWHGGLGLEVPGINGFSLQEEPRSASWAKLTDDFGNEWTGLRLTTRIEKHEGNRGITVDQYQLMLPGAPVLCTLYSVTNGTGLYHPNFMLISRNFFRPSPEFSEGWMEIPGENRFHMGQVEAEITLEGLLRIGAVNRSGLLHAVHHHQQRAWAYLNNKVLNHVLHHGMELPGGQTRWSQPSFLVMGEQELHQEEVQSLLRVTFNGVK